MPGSPAAVAGLAPLDRIYEVDGQSFDSNQDFGELLISRLDAGQPQITLLVETTGYVRPVVVAMQAPR